MDIENLSKEELVRLIKSQKPNPQKTEICKFRPLKQNLPPCTEPSINPWGFCKKHSKTIQALNAEKEYEEHKKIEEQKKKDEEYAREIEKLKLEQKKAQPPPAPIKQQVTNPPARQVTTKKIIIKPNKYGRYEEPESHILFNFETKCAYGVQGPNGKVTALTPKHIAICEKNKWKYNKIVEDSDDDEEEEEDDDAEEEDDEEEENEEEEEEEIEDEEEEESEDDDDESDYSDSD